jgi:predicted  nucleic acid-binding Zn-ribbon protein
MRRPHRSIETFDISLMAVVTKAMGAFLVLMLLLMPYYSSSPLGKDEAEDLARKVQDADAKIKGVLNRLGDKELGKDLVSARVELGSGQQLIGQLKRYVDQLSAQVTRLEQKIVTLTAELDQLKKDKSTLSARVAELEKENAALKAENEKLKAEVESLNKRIAELEKMIADLNKRIAELEKSEPEKVEALKKEIEDLKKEIARLEQENDDLNARVATLEDEAARLRARNAELEQQNTQLNALVVPLQQENAASKAKIAELETLLSQMRQENKVLKGHPVLAGSAQGDCTTVTIGTFRKNMMLDEEKDTNVLNFNNGFGVSFVGTKFGARYISTFIASGIGPGRYFFLLVSRAESQSDDDEGVPPLLPAKGSCTALASLIYSGRGAGVNRRYQVDFEPGQAVQYFGDAVIGADMQVNFSGPSPEGEAWLKDQLARAKLVSSEAPRPSGAGGTRQAPPTATGDGAVMQIVPEDGRIPRSAPGERR